jgi:hypothetical protein
MKKLAIVLTGLALTVAASTTVFATPSTQIWIPSTDVQAFKVVHLGIDNYIRTSGKGGGANTADLGLTVGVLPFEKIQAEIGIDYMESGTNSVADKAPIYFNAKIGTPEDSIFKFSPALAVGTYNMGTKLGVTTQNVAYGLAARTFPVIGRLSLGGFQGSETVLGSGMSKGVLASWDRTMTEISDKLWMAVDYQGGNSSLGALNFGVSWAFTKDVSVIFGYDIYNNVNTGGKNTFTTQLDINF